MENRQRIILIDGSGYIFRAFYAILRLSNSSGFPTNAVLGFTNMLLKVLDLEKPTHLGIAFDTSGPTFRKERYAEYKANRQSAPEDLVKQIPWIHKSVDSFGVFRIEKPGFEADDLLGTLARRAVADGFRVEIITGDKDLMQLVDENITLFDTMKDRRIDIEGVKERFGVAPEQIVDFLALVGDSSDNIPGVSGIGEKTATELIQQFGSLDKMYASLDQIKQAKRRERLETDRETAFLSRELATIKCDVDIAFDWDALVYRGPRHEVLGPFLKEMEFTNLIKKFGIGESESQIDRSKYRTISTEEELKVLVAELRKAEVVALDTETTSLNARDAQCVGISLAATEGEGVYLPIGHTVGGALRPGQLPVDRAVALLRPFLEDRAVQKVGQNLKYDIQILRGLGISMQGVAGDTMLESYLINPDEAHGLDALAQRYLGHQNIKYADVAGTGKAQVSFAEVPIDKATEYSAEDADVTLRLHHLLRPKIDENELTDLFEKIEVPLVSVLAEMEYQGVRVDVPLLRKMSEGLDAELKTSEREIFSLAGESFNINSPKQLGTILFTKLALPIVKRTKTGPSTDESVLEKLAEEHAICRKIVRYRELGKLRSTYVEGLLSQVSPRTGRVHTSYNQTVAATGRLSSTNPNLQNIPVTPGDFDIRSAFIAEDGYRLLSADYSQVELRLLADMSEDPELLRAFRDGEDVHEFTGRRIFNVDTITPEQRRIAKTINFGVVYGQTPFGLSQTLGIPPKDAKEFIEKYFARYSKVQAFLRSLAELARENGYSISKLGRRRYISEINSQNRMRREMAERAAINMPLQGTAADLIKKAMISLDVRLKKERMKSRLILQVHDELVLEVPEDESDRAEKILCEEMENALELKVPLKVDFGWGRNWRETDG